MWPSAPVAAHRPRTPGSVRLGLVLALLGAGALAVVGSMLFLLGLVFADTGHPGRAASLGLVWMAPNAVLANLLVAGGVRLRAGHADGRWWLTAAALLDVATAVVWAEHLQLGDGVEVFAQALVWLLGPALLAAVLAWTPNARRWTSGARPGYAAQASPAL